jgi:hypothetical protein
MFQYTLVLFAIFCDAAQVDDNGEGDEEFFDVCEELPGLKSCHNNILIVLLSLLNYVLTLARSYVNIVCEQISCSKSSITANRILGMIKRSFCYLSKDVVLKLYKSLVRPHLEYCVQAWRSYSRKDIKLIEGSKDEQLN